MSDRPIIEITVSGAVGIGKSAVALAILDALRACYLECTWGQEASERNLGTGASDIAALETKPVVRLVETAGVLDTSSFQAIEHALDKAGAPMTTSIDPFTGRWLMLTERIEALAAGWCVGDASGERWRCWGESGPEWTTDRNKALRFARRADAESFAHNDEDAWTISSFRAVPTPTKQEPARPKPLSRALDAFDSACMRHARDSQAIPETYTCANTGTRVSWIGYTRADRLAVLEAAITAYNQEQSHE